MVEGGSSVSGPEAGLSTADETAWSVVRNDRGQYSIWPEWKAMPQGWERGGARGSRDDCLAYIGRTWTDIQPPSSG